MSRIILALFFLFLAVPVAAHEGHKQDKTDAEMAAEAIAPMGEHVDMSMAPDSEMHAPAPTTITPQEALLARVEANRLDGVDDLLGRLHPMAAHFPIALLLVAALTELVFALRPGLALSAVVRLAVAGGAIGAVVSALLGWFAAGWRLSDRSELLGIHRWSGTALAVASLLAWWLANRAGERRTALRVMLAAIAVATAFQGYLGGEMVFGPNHLGLR